MKLETTLSTLVIAILMVACGKAEPSIPQSTIAPVTDTPTKTASHTPTFTPTPTDTATSTPTSTPTPTEVVIDPDQYPFVNCIDYNPNSLQIIEVEDDVQGDYFSLIDNSVNPPIVVVRYLNNRKDANQALNLAIGHKQRCSIGREVNTGYRDGMDFWQEYSGIESDLVDRDCPTYNPERLEIELQQGLHIIVSNNSHYMVGFRNLDEANLGLSIVEKHTRTCYIGRDNERTDRDNFLVGYWKTEENLNLIDN